MYIAQIVYLLAAKLISSSPNRSLCMCPLLEAEQALQEADSLHWSGVNKESKCQELVRVLNNLFDLSEVLQQMPFGIRRTAVGSRHSWAKRESDLLLCFVQAYYFCGAEEFYSLLWTWFSGRSSLNWISHHFAFGPESKVFVLWRGLWTEMKQFPLKTHGCVCLTWERLWNKIKALHLEIPSGEWWDHIWVFL